MDINIISRHRVLALGFVTLMLGVAPAFAQSQAQQNSNTGCYSGPGFEAEKNEACHNLGAHPAAPDQQMQEQNQNAAQPGPYSGTPSEIEKEHMRQYGH